MTLRVRDMLNSEIGIVKMPLDWWIRQVRAAFFTIDGFMLVVALRNVPAARDCTSIGLAHGQCVEVAEGEHPVTAVISRMKARDACMKNCRAFFNTWPRPKKLIQQCVNEGIISICYTRGSPSVRASKELRARGIEVLRVRI